MEKTGTGKEGKMKDGDDDEEEEEGGGQGWTRRYFQPYQRWGGRAVKNNWVSILILPFFLARGLWDLLEKPHSSLAAKIISLFSISFVIISTIGMCLNTLPALQVASSFSDYIDNFDLPDLRLILICTIWQVRHPDKVELMDNPWLALIEVRRSVMFSWL